jgi:hemoglobin-like flavoprotein
MAELRTKLFLSYSKVNSKWRDAFESQLRTLFDSEHLWIDRESLVGGEPWGPAIEKAIEQSRCALVLVTPDYLDRGSYSRKEFEYLLKQMPDLIVLPVLVDDCPWQEIEDLSETQFLRWGNDDERIVGGRATLAPLPALTSHKCKPAIVRICGDVKKQLGVVGQARKDQLDALFAATQARLGEIQLEQNAVHSGTFSVIYRGTLHGDTVAVKAVPDAPRQNRIRAVLMDTLPKIRKLTDGAFIHLRDSSVDGEPHYFVMDYVEWPTLEQRLADGPEHCLDPSTVAVVLEQVARAHHDAHDAGLLIGPLTLGSIHLSDQQRVRLSPLRIEGMLARASYMSTGQLMNWEALTYLAPEISAGQPVGGLDPQAVDRLDQYYLGLLGLELLIGRPPCDVRCFDDLAIKARFFDDPRTFFDPSGSGWTDKSPALAYLLTRLLDRDPARRLANSDDVAEELELIERGRLPDSLTRQLEADLAQLGTPGFADAFYEKLFRARPALAARFGDRARQTRMLAEALSDLVDFRPERPRANRHFVQLAEKHARLGLAGEDIASFQSCFLNQVDETFDHKAGHADAWRAVLEPGLAALLGDTTAR